jgi:RND superfamily putative drug exporter
MERLIGFVLRRPRQILAAGLVLFAAGGILGTPITNELKAQTRDFQDPQAENVRAEDEVKAATGVSDRGGLLVVLPTAGDIRSDPASRTKVRAAVRIVAADPNVALAQNPLSGAPDTRIGISRDGHSALIAATLHEGDTEPTVKRLRAALHGTGARIGGARVVFSEIGTRVTHDLGRAELLAFPLLFLLSLLIFRSGVAALLPPLVGGLAIVTTFGVLRIVEHEVTGLSIFALNLVTGVGLGLAIDYSLFIVSRFREELAQGRDKAAAIRVTMQTAGRTVLFSSLTVGAAIAAMLVFPLRFLYSMGIGGAIVATVAAALALTVLPALLYVLGDRVNALAPQRLRRSAEADARPAGSGAWYRLAHTVMRRPILVAVATASVLVLAGLPFLRVNFISADHRMLPAAATARQVTEQVQQDFPAVAGEPIRVIAQAPATAPDVTALRRSLAALPGAGGVTAPQQLGSRLSEIDMSPRGDPLNARNLELLKRVRNIQTPVRIKVAGSAARFRDQHAALAARLPIAIAILAVTTFVILFAMTGSVVLPIKALLMNLLSLSAAFGILVLIFQDGRLEGLLDFRSAGGLESTQPVLLFAIAFGLATDYGVFLLSRIKEAHDSGMDNREAVAFGVERTGRIVTAAALLFCVAIGAFATSGVLFIKQLGVGTALAVAIDATVIRALLVPALMVLLGRRNWWAPAPLRRLHARIGLRESSAPA